MFPVRALLDAATKQALAIAAVAQRVGYPITQRCLLKARAIVDGRELRGGTLELTTPDAAPPIR